MNKLNDNVLGIIYQYKHQLEFKDVMNELIKHKIHCRYNVTIEMLKYMFYVNTDGFKIACIDVSSISVFSHEILNEIKNNK